MEYKSLISEGRLLIEALREQANHYHVKSSRHDDFMWEVVGVKTKLDILVSGDIGELKTAVSDNFRSGTEKMKDNAELYQQFLSFYEKLYLVVQASHPD